MLPLNLRPMRAQETGLNRQTTFVDFRFWPVVHSKLGTDRAGQTLISPCTVHLSGQIVSDLR